MKRWVNERPDEFQLRLLYMKTRETKHRPEYVRSIYRSIKDKKTDWLWNLYLANEYPKIKEGITFDRLVPLLQTCLEEDNIRSKTVRDFGDYKYFVAPLILKPGDPVRFIHEIYERYEEFLKNGSRTGLNALSKRLISYAGFVSLAKLEIQSGSDFEDEDAEEHEASFVEGILWTPEEKRKFFVALERCGPRDAVEISRRVGTKSATEVAIYIKVLDQFSKGLQFDTARDPKYSAREMSNFFVCLEEIVAVDLERQMETESFADHQKLLFDDSNVLAKKSMEIFNILALSDFTKMYSRKNDMVVLSNTLVAMYQLLKQFIYDILMNAHTELSASKDKVVDRPFMNHLLAKRKRLWKDADERPDKRLRRMDLNEILDPYYRQFNKSMIFKSASFLSKRRRRVWETPESLQYVHEFEVDDEKAFKNKSEREEEYGEEEDFEKTEGFEKKEDFETTEDFEKRKKHNENGRQLRKVLRDIRLQAPEINIDTFYKLGFKQFEKKKQSGKVPWLPGNNKKARTDGEDSLIDEYDAFSRGLKGQDDEDGTNQEEENTEDDSSETGDSSDESDEDKMSTFSGSASQSDYEDSDEEDQKSEDEEMESSQDKLNNNETEEREAIESPSSAADLDRETTGNEQTTEDTINNSRDTDEDSIKDSDDERDSMDELFDKHDGLTGYFYRIDEFRSYESMIAEKEELGEVISDEEDSEDLEEIEKMKKIDDDEELSMRLLDRAYEEKLYKLIFRCE